MSGLERKCVGGVCEIKNATQGEVVAIIATLGLVDREGDVILKGAIPPKSPVKLSAYGHDVVLDGAAPVGKGTISEEGDKAVLRARYFLSTTKGREAFHTVKELGADGEWSFGFPRGVQTADLTDEWRVRGARRVIRGIQPVEASPVFRGAGVGTGLLSAKCDGCGKSQGAVCSCSSGVKPTAPPRPADLKEWVASYGQERIVRRVIAIGRRRWSIKTAPQIRWFKNNGRVWGETLDRHPPEIWIQSGLDDDATALTALHELWHVRELEHLEPPNERCADGMARRLLGELDDPRHDVLNYGARA